jgi:septal ring factor EnvC (AmiA/AmiB activator)
MSRGKMALAILVVSVLAIWGCARGPSNDAERIAALEERFAKLEADYHAAVADRDAVKKKLSTVEDERNKLQQDTDREREDWKQQMSTRTTERDAVQSQYDQFRKSLRALLGQADATAGGSNPPAAAITLPADPNKS